MKLTRAGPKWTSGLTRCVGRPHGVGIGCLITSRKGVLDRRASSRHVQRRSGHQGRSRSESVRRRADRQDDQVGSVKLIEPRALRLAFALGFHSRAPAQQPVEPEPRQRQHAFDYAFCDGTLSAEIRASRRRALPEKSLLDTCGGNPALNRVVGKVSAAGQAQDPRHDRGAARTSRRVFWKHTVTMGGSCTRCR